jgi:hypothetical protein
MAGKSLTCYTCHNSILSDKHRDKCITVYMYSKKECSLKDLVSHKSMMTFGLRGCTAFILHIKSNNKIIMGHHPEKVAIMNWLNNHLQNLDKTSKVSLYIKIPQEYEKQPNGKYDYKKTSVFDIYNDHPLIEKTIIEPYSTDRYNSTYSHNSTLYCRANNSGENCKIEYSNTWGKWLEI